ncbi:MAG: dihydrofolate synthase / folylpolyglutamate synthase [Candidatus Poribacteria bacterium]|nr:dihydrofolate synthase / folylpolyglutamate synthase [Candidatus Poribacteria bacterium]
MISYNEAIQYLESFIDYEKIAAPYDPFGWKLERVERLLESIDNPHKELKVIHVAGTKGKGSTSAMIASVLREAGFKVGLYISPHLVTFRERITINGEMISRDQVCEMVERIKPNVKELLKQEDTIGKISFFDVYTALALLFFKIEQVDFTVLEVGMGGRLDATNVVNPLVSVITQISYDHMSALGNTLEAIAREKAGIIKDNGYVVTSPQEPEALQVIKDTCAEKVAMLFEVGRDITYQKIKGRENLFNVSGIFSTHENLHVSLLGDHQVINATTAIGALECLWFHGIAISHESIKNGLDSVKWRARVEVIQRNPIIILDVAHNAASAKALRDTIEANFTYDKLILILEVSQHKDVKGMGQYLCPMADIFILTKMNNPRAMEPEEIKKELTELRNDFIITQDVRSAIEKARAIAGKNDLICVTGSLILAGEVMRILDNELHFDLSEDFDEPHIVINSEGE